MIFLDESGKRWRRIKAGTGLLGSGVIIPMVVLLGATLLYLPGWGSLSLPKPIKTAQKGNPKASSGSQVLAAQSTSNHSSNPNVSKNSSVSSDSSAPDAASSSAPQSTAATTQTPSAQVTDTTQPTPAPTTTTTAPGLTNQPDQTGNSDYGRSHQPTRF